LRILRGRPRNFGWSTFLTRLFGSLFLVLSTFNPSGWSIWHWTAVAWPEEWMLLLPIILTYLFVYILVLRITYRSLRFPGIGLVVALIGSFVWVLVTAGIVPLANGADLGIILLYMFGGLLAVGLSWSHAYLMITGQVSIDNLNV
jgi:hypothetical protein